jgi:DNA-binding SARP family transcriptional activator
VEFRLLGPFEAAQDGRPVRIAGRRERALLAVLLLNASRTLSLDRLIDELWGEDVPATAGKVVQGYVSQLRRALPANLLHTRPPGYLIELGEHELDLHRFERLVAEGRRALAEAKAETASRSLREALALWRGPALAEFTPAPFAQSEGARLEELRLSALEERVEAELALGLHSELVGELEALVARHLRRERLREQLMLALYRSGRQAEALAAYQEARRTLVEELGLDPGRSLQELERAILRQDPRLDPPPQSSRRLAAPAPHPQREVPVREEATFIGRERELAMLIDVLEDAVAGRGRLVLVAGEPGIGKTRLVEELARRARERSVLVLTGRCYEREGAPPYWPWTQALRALAHACEPSELRAWAGTGAASIAEVFREMRDHLAPSESPASSVDPKQARFLLFDSITTLLRNAGQGRQLVVVLEDLHAADSGSLMLLEFVARELAGARLLVLGTYRDVDVARGHPLVETLAELTRERLFARILLRGLSEEDVRQFVEAATDIPAPSALVAAIHRQTEGNALFLTEFLRLLIQDGELTPERLRNRQTWSLRIPEGVREVIGRRLDRLPKPCDDILRIASLIGREFGLDQLTRLVDALSEDELLDALEKALAEGLIEELPRTVARYRFAHALIQETLADELSVTRRVRLHARIAEMLESLFGAQADDHAAELVHHFAEAEAALGSSKLVHFSLVAGERALAVRAYEQALGYFEGALMAKQDEPLDTETAALLFGLGRAQLAILERHELEDGVANLRRAFEYYAQAGNRDEAVAIASYPIPRAVCPGVFPSLPPLVSRALSLVRPGSLERGRLLSTYAWFTGIDDANYAEAQEAFAEPLEIAASAADASLTMRTLLSAAHVDWFHLRWDDCLAKATRSIDLALAAADARTEMIARSYAGRILMVRGEAHEARRVLTPTLAHADRLRERYWIATTRWNHQLLCLLDGGWTRARELSEVGLTAEPSDARQLASRALVEAQLGNTDEAEIFLERLAETQRLAAVGPSEPSTFTAAVIPLVERVTGRRGRSAIAEAAAEKVTSSKQATPLFEMIARVGLALIALAQNDVSRAAEQYEELRSQQGTALIPVGMAADRLLGLLAARSGQLAAAKEHFEAALSFCGRSGYRSEYAWTAADYADVLLEHAAGPRDRENALALQEESRRIASDAGTRPLCERIAAARTP